LLDTNIGNETLSPLESPTVELVTTNINKPKLNFGLPRAV
jgi:hypothetical protein